MLLRKNAMENKEPKKYTVADVYQEANKMLQEELVGLKKKPLSESDEKKMKELARLLSNVVLKEMNIV